MKASIAGKSEICRRIASTKTTGTCKRPFGKTTREEQIKQFLLQYYTATSTQELLMSSPCVGQPLVLESVRVAPHGLQSLGHAVVHPGVDHVVPWLPLEGLLVAPIVSIAWPTRTTKCNGRQIRRVGTDGVRKGEEPTTKVLLLHVQ